MESYTILERQQSNLLFEHFVSKIMQVLSKILRLGVGKKDEEIVRHKSQVFYE